MTNKAKLILLLILVCLTTRAQSDTSLPNKGEVKGVTLDAQTNEPLPFVTVAIKVKETGTIVSGQISDGKGNFTVTELPAGVFSVEFQFIGYETKTLEITLAKNEKQNLGIILLKEDALAVDGVEVTAERSTIEQKADKKVIHIGKDLATAGVTAADVMANIPSVSVDPNGSISMRGNSNVRILVNGKPTNLSSEQLLRQIPSSSIKSVEIITNPSAKFIPDGMSGIINVILHKNTAAGFNGNFSTGFTFGQNFRFNGSTDLNFRKDKLNVYGSYGHSHGINPTWGTITRPNDPSEETWAFSDDPVSHLIKAGLDYEVTKRTVVSVFGIYNRFKNNATRLTYISFPENAINDMLQQYLSDVNNRNVTFNFDLKHSFPKKGSSIEFEIDYSEFNSSDDALFTIDEAQVSGPVNVYEDIHIGRKNTTINLDYTNQLGENKKLEAGLELRIQETDNDYKTTHPDFNHALYDFNRDIYALYLNYSHVVGKWSYQIGARVENFDMVGHLREEGLNDQEYNSPVFSVYPSAFVSYTPNPKTQKNVFNLSLSRRVDRPNLEQMTPIRVWSSPRITNIGNPALLPQFTNSVELNYTRQLKQGSLTTGVFVRQIHDEITRFAFTAPSDEANIYFSYNNYQDNVAYGFEVSGNYSPTPFWSFNSSFDVYGQKQRGLVREELLEVQNTLYNFRMNHSFKVNKKLTLQLIGLYRAANTNLQYKRLSFSFINVGGRYSLFKDNGTLSISFNDIFKTQQNTFEADRPVIQEGSFDWDSRTLMISYAHRLGNGKNQSRKRKTRDSNEVKSGGF